jgi:hypothetical protein
MNTRKGIILASAVLFLAVLILIIRPVPHGNIENCINAKGTVTAVYEAGTNDVVFRLAGLDKEFYVNRGLERGLDLTKLRAELTNKVVVISYPKYWTPLDPQNSIRRVSQLEYDGKIVFTEID